MSSGTTVLVANALQSIGYLLFLIGILIGPVANLATDCKEHQALCDRRKIIFANLAYAFLAFWLIGLFLTGNVFSTVKNIANQPGEALKKGYQLGQELAAQGMAAVSTVASSTMKATGSAAAVASSTIGGAGGATETLSAPM